MGQVKSLSNSVGISSMVLQYGTLNVFNLQIAICTQEHMQSLRWLKNDNKNQNLEAKKSTLL